MVSKGVTVSTNDTVILNATDVWAVNTQETSAQFEARVTAQIDSLSKRSLFPAPAVWVLED